VTVASAERSFSKLKLLKNYLRSAMSQERLNGLATICIEKGLLDQINVDNIINDFASTNFRKKKVYIIFVYFASQCKIRVQAGVLAGDLECKHKCEQEHELEFELKCN
jgi:hypothetical protein